MISSLNVWTSTFVCLHNKCSHNTPASRRCLSILARRLRLTRAGPAVVVRLRRRDPCRDVFEEVLAEAEGPSSVDVEDVLVGLERGEV